MPCERGQPRNGEIDMSKGRARTSLQAGRFTSDWYGCKKVVQGRGAPFPWDGKDCQDFLQTVKLLFGDHFQPRDKADSDAFLIHEWRRVFEGRKALLTGQKDVSREPPLGGRLRLLQPRGFIQLIRKWPFRVPLASASGCWDRPCHGFPHIPCVEESEYRSPTRPEGPVFCSNSPSLRYSVPPCLRFSSHHPRIALRSSSGVPMGMMLKFFTSTSSTLGVTKAGRLGPSRISLMPR